MRALNTIEIEFVKRKADDFFGDDSSEQVLEAWAAYRAALFTPRPFVGDPPDPNDQAAAERWDATTNDLLVELLYVMARAVGYDFDRDFIRSAYAPLGHFNNEIEAMTMRGALGKVLRGETALRITSEAPPTSTVAQPALDGLPLRQPVLSAPDVDDPKK